MRKKSYAVRATAVILAAGLIVSSVCGVEADAASKKTVSLSKSKVKITAGKTKKITVKKTKKTKIKKVKWSISKGKKIVKLSKKKKTGVTIKGLKKGSATVTAKITLKNKKKPVTGKVKVTVKKANKTDKKDTSGPSVNVTPAPDGTPAPTSNGTPAPTENPPSAAKSDISIQAFAMSDVVVTDEYYGNALSKETAYLKKLDEKKLLAGFKETAGYAAGMSAADVKTYMGTTRYTGGGENWENSLIGGHTLGHYLTALAQAVSNPSTADADRAELQKKLDNIIDTLKECQEKTKGSSACKEGYLFGATLLSTSNLELQFDNVEANKADIGTQAWVPWYTMHKILAGLVSVYELTGDGDALAVAESLGEWTYNRAKGWSAAKRNTVLGIEYGGMNDSLYELALCTSNETYRSHFLEAAAQFDETALFEKVKKGGKDVLNNLHANTTIPKFLGALNRYVSLAKLGKLKAEDEVYLEYVEAFWDMVVNNHSYITGGCSEWEHFGADHVLDSERTNCNNETCCTYNMLKMSRVLFQITGNKKYSDYYEKVLINAIMASQNPETGMSMYFQPMKSGYFKVFGTETQDFWCCTGSGMENFTKLNDSIYFHKDNDVYVNQYRSSVLTWNEKNVKVIQTADLLTGTAQKFVVEAINGKSETDINMLFRIPDYASGDVIVKVNGSVYNYKKTESGYARVAGKFASGTEITVDIPEEVTYENLSDKKGTEVYGFKYGPFVLAADLGNENTSASDIGTTGVTVDIPKASCLGSELVSIGVEDGDISKWLGKINTYMEKTVKDGTVSFAMKGTDKKYTFVPYYQIYKNRYGIYWNFTKDESAIVLSKKTAAREEKRLDSVQPGYGQNESDDKHALIQEKTEAQTASGSSRWTKEGGSFSYRMTVSREEDTTLICQFAKEDNGKTIQIKVGDTEIASDTLDYKGEEDIYRVFYTIPKDIALENLDTAYTEEDVVRVTFSGRDGAASAALYNEIYTYKAIGAVAELKNAPRITGYSQNPVTQDGDTYELEVDKDTAKVTVAFDLKDTNGYMELNGKAIDDSKEQEINIRSLRVAKCEIRVYAEDFVTYKDYVFNIKKTYEFDPGIEYFVDCGDYNVTTVSEGDKLGRCNSVTEQVYGEDPITGKMWGVVDTCSDPLKNGTSDVTEDAAYTDNTWPFETDSTVTDGVAKTRTNRYTKNQFENKIPVRYLDYEFELENGEYEVEVGFTNPWNCSTNPRLYAYFGEDNQQVLAERIGVPAAGKTVTGTVTVTGGKLALNARSEANDDTTKAINMTYIIIKKKAD